MNKKLAVYVDGFNLYHGLKNLNKPFLKWLNLRSLVEKFIDRKTESITKIYYFSAIATHLDQETSSRHRTYIEALKTENISFIEGHFKKKLYQYKNKHIQLSWNKHEEKETDVNLAIYLVRDSVAKLFDKLILLTNDTDIVPAVKMARSENAHLKIKLLTPPTFKAHDSLKEVTHPEKWTQIQEKHIELSLFRDEIKKPNGKIIYIPSAYKRK